MNHITKLVNAGCNLATSHKAFDMFTPQLLESIQEYEYTLIIDETINVMEYGRYFYDDVKTMVDAGNLEYVDGFYRFCGSQDLLEGQSYFSDMYRLAYSKNLYMFENEEDRIKGNPKGKYYYFTLPLDFIKVFKDVYILTYYFSSSELYLLFKMHNVEYKTIGVEKKGGAYRLSETGYYTSDTIKNLNKLIHICEDDVCAPSVGRPRAKFNTYKTKHNNRSIDKSFHLTRSFYEKKENERIVKIVRNNNQRFIDGVISEVGGDKKTDCVWTVYKSLIDRVKSPKIQDCWIPLNSRATNKYGDRTIFSWLVELYQPPPKKKYFEKFGNGVVMDEKAICLSTIIQAVFRTAIRNGREIFIYMPSKRSREMFAKWVNDVSNGVIYR